MINKSLLLLLIACVLSLAARCQVTEIVVLNSAEAGRLRALVATNKQVKQLYDSIARLAGQQLSDTPRPLSKIHYEGLLDNNPDRIDTRKSLEDVDKVVNLVYASYASRDAVFAIKAKEIVLAWAGTYRPNANTINENKFIPLFWAYYLFRKKFSIQEKKRVEDWMINIAQGQMTRPRTPNNNWEAKRQIIIGTVGSIVGDTAMKDIALRGLKAFINTAYYVDGTSNDLRERDALHYHVGGIKPAIAAFINLAPFDSAFNLFNYVSTSGASIGKSVEYTLPYATGEIKRKEWTNSKVALDKKRAEAGLAEYQPGMLFNPREAIVMFEWAAYYNPTWYALLGSGNAADNYTSTWVGLLNSPLIRK